MVGNLVYQTYRLFETRCYVLKVSGNILVLRLRFSIFVRGAALIP